MAYKYRKISDVLSANHASEVLVKADNVAVDYDEVDTGLGFDQFVCNKKLSLYLEELVTIALLNDYDYASKEYVLELIHQSGTGGEINLSDYAKLTELQKYAKLENLKEYVKSGDLTKYMSNEHPAAGITSKQIQDWDSTLSQLEDLKDRINNLLSTPSGSGISNIVVSLNGSSIQATIQDNTATINLPSLQTEESDPIFTALLENLVTVSNIREKGSAYFAEVSDVNALTLKVAEFADALANASSDDLAIANLSTKVNNLSDDVKELSDKVNDMIMIEVCTLKEYDDLGDGIKTDVLYLISE